MNNLLNEKSYWMITGQWSEYIPPPSTIATPDNPNPHSKGRIVPIQLTEYVTMHPAVFFVFASINRSGYVITNTLQVSKKHYEWAMSNMKKINDAIAAQKSGDVILDPVPTEDETSEQPVLPDSTDSNLKATGDNTDGGEN